MRKDEVKNPYADWKIGAPCTFWFDRKEPVRYDCLQGYFAGVDRVGNPCSFRSVQRGGVGMLESWPHARLIG